MSIRLGPGPVFVFESLILARRRQIYAGRALYVLVMLIGLFLAWQMRGARLAARHDRRCRVDHRRHGQCR